MNNSPINFLLVIVIFLILIFLIFSIVKVFITYINKKIYTRDRFAFFSVGALLSTLGLLFGYMKKNYVIDILNFLFNFLNEQFQFKLNLIPNNSENPNFMEIGFFAFIFSIFAYFLFKIFKNWTGEKSNKQFEDEKLHEIIGIYSFFESAFSYLHKKESSKPASVYDKTFYDSDIEISQIENLPWNVQSAELLKLISNQYKINIENDWYRDENCFLSKYGKNDDNICIYCPIYNPDKNEIHAKIDFANGIASSRISKFILCIRNDFEISSIEVKNLEIICYTESKLLSELIDFSSYRQNIIDKFEKKEIIKGYGFTLNDTYVTPQGEIFNRSLLNENILKFRDGVKKNTSVFKNNGVIRNLDNYIKEWILSNKEQKQLAILGEYGQGKSVLAHRICYLIFKGLIKTDRIPILITLGGKYPKQFEDIKNFFADWAIHYGINPNALTKLFYAGKLLIIFDGFDETELIGEYSIRLEHFRKLWKFNIHNSKLIITGRPNYFLDNRELETLLRTHEKFKESSAYCEEIHLKKFNLDQIKLALRNQKNEIVNEIDNLLKKTGLESSFYDLLSRPSHLFLASLIWEKELSKYKENINSARVYECFIRDSSLRQENKKLTPPLTLNERNFFMEGIALNSLQVNGFTNTFDSSFINKTIEKLLTNIPNDLNDENGVLLNESYKNNLQDRFNNNIIETIANDVRSCGIIVRDLSSFNGFRFAHKSFFEYFISNFYQYECLKERNISFKINNSFKKSLEIDKNSIKLKPEIFKFVLEILILRISGNSSVKKSDYEKTALDIFFKLYPYRFLKNKIKIAYIIRPIARLKINLRIATTMLFTSGVFLVLSQLISLAINKFSFADLDFFNIFMGIVFILTGIFYIKLINSINTKLIQDSDNFLIWYGCCCQLNIDRATFYKLIGKRRYRKLSLEYIEMMKPSIKLRNNFYSEVGNILIDVIKKV